MNNRSKFFLPLLAFSSRLFFAVIFYGVWKNARREDRNALEHETKREMPTMAPPVKELVPVSAIETETAGVVSEKAVDLKGLKKTEENLFGRIRSLFKTDANNKHLEEIEEILYTSDLGPTTVQRLMGALEDKLSKKRAH